MSQICEALVETVMRFLRDYGPIIAWSVVGLVAAGVALRVLARLLQSTRRDPPS